MWGKKQRKEHLGVGGVGICCFIQPMAAKVQKEISLCFWGPKARNSSRNVPG
jgi:hypothetical protein